MPQKAGDRSSVGLKALDWPWAGMDEVSASKFAAAGSCRCCGNNVVSEHVRLKTGWLVTFKFGYVVVLRRFPDRVHQQNSSVIEGVNTSWPRSCCCGSHMFIF